MVVVPWTDWVKGGKPEQLTALFVESLVQVAGLVLR